MRKTPVRHKVRAYKKRTATVHSYVRGRGARAMRTVSIAKPTLAVPLYWTEKKSGREGVCEYVKGDKESQLHVAITSEDTSIMHEHAYEYEVHSWLSNNGDPNVGEMHGGARTRAEAEALARKVMDTIV